MASIAMRFKAYLDRATELEPRYPVVSFYIQLYVIEKLMVLRKLGQKDDNSEKLLITLLDAVEWWKTKHGLGNPDNMKEERKTVVEFVLMVFKN